MWSLWEDNQGPHSRSLEQTRSIDVVVDFPVAKMGTKRNPADEAESNPGLPGGLEMMIASLDA